MPTDLTHFAQASKLASRQLAQADNAHKNAALLAIQSQLVHAKHTILNCNTREVEAAKNNGHPPAFLDRLTLNSERFDAMLDGLNAIAALPNPVGRTLKQWTVPSGLHITRKAVPLGVIAVIYEARPNVTADAGALCLKSGNAVILRGGSECTQTNLAMVRAMQAGLATANLNPNSIQYIPEQNRETLNELLKLDEYIDVIIPRGGKKLIQHIQTHSHIPVFSHLAGLCHTYIHEKASPKMALEIICNAKMRRTGICGATETVLLDHTIATDLLPKLVTALNDLGCELRGDERACSLDGRLQTATEADWQTEYLAPILAIKIVNDINEAIAHIQTYSSSHTDAIITEDAHATTQFFNEVDSAIVMHNASTQFADGGEFGLGAEIGIATGKLHARGPVGVEQLTTFKYCVEGSGQIRP